MNIAVIGEGISCASIAVYIRDLLPKENIVAYYYQYKLKDEIIKESPELKIYKFIKFRDNLSAFYLKLIENYDVILSCGWSHKVDDNAIKTRKFFNIHPSLLPQYRGVKPIERQLKDDSIIFGVTVHEMDNDYDTGPIFEQAKIICTRDIGIEQLTNLLIYGAKMLVKDFLELYPMIKVFPQSESEIWKKTIKYELECDK